MALKLYNTLTKKIQKFKPIDDNKVRIYACGPTVYSYAHIGNLRTYIAEDILKRTLIADGYKVLHVMNITDVGHLVGDMDVGEDKVKSAAHALGKSAKEVAEYYTKIFLNDLKSLNILMPDIMPKASEHVNEILDLIRRLDKKGYIYKLDTGMYFDTSLFKDYGKLSGMSFEKLNASIKAGARVERPDGLKNATDFAVWRFSKPDEKEMVWDCEYGRGFPGWHIECSAMSMKYLGEHFDIHCGGIDHINIHHTNEIAQSEGATGKKFVNFWFHVAFLKVENQKMSKSLGNIYTLSDLVSKGFSPLAFRYLVISAHYRSELNFRFESLTNAQNTLSKIKETIFYLKNIEKEGEVRKSLEKKINSLVKGFYRDLNNDLNTPLALEKFHKIIGLANKNMESLNKNEAQLFLKAIEKIDNEILALDLIQNVEPVENLPESVKALIKKREALRAQQKYEEADAIRRELKEKYNIELIDTKEGTKIKKIS